MALLRVIKSHLTFSCLYKRIQTILWKNHFLYVGYRCWVFHVLGKILLLIFLFLTSPLPIKTSLAKTQKICEHNKTIATYSKQFQRFLTTLLEFMLRITLRDKHKSKQIRYILQITSNLSRGK